MKRAAVSRGLSGRRPVAALRRVGGGGVREVLRRVNVRGMNGNM